jgi:hydrogenase nickel incorporation protein HypA/HybF
LVIEDMPVIVYCAPCDAQRTVTAPQWFSCPVCGAPTPEVVQGKELEVSALEITELEVQR